MIINVVLLILLVWNLNSPKLSELESKLESIKSNTKTQLELKQKLLDQQHEMLTAAIDRENALNSRIYHLAGEYERELQTWKHQEEKRIREDAVAKSRQVQRGYTSEHYAPFQLPQFSSKDFRFVGGAIDYIVFANLSDYNGDSSPVHIYLMEIKTGEATLTKGQRLIRDAVKEGRVTFAIYNPDKEELKTYPCQINL